MLRAFFVSLSRTASNGSSRSGKEDGGRAYVSAAAEREKMKEGRRRAITAGLGPGQNQPLKPLKHGSLQQRFSSRAWLN